MNTSVPPPCDGRMHRHPHYLHSLRLIGAEARRLPCGLAVQRRIGPLTVTWLPEPEHLPGLRSLPGITLIGAANTAMDMALSGTGAIPVMTPQARAVLDLTLPGPMRRTLLHQKWRNRLCRAEEAGLKVTHAPLPDDPNHWLLRAETAQRRSRRYRALPPAFALAWPETRLFTASFGDRPVAAMLFLLHAPGASYHIGWTGPEGRRLNAHALLLWQAADWLAQRGIARLDLGTVETREAPGLARFKLGTGAQVETSGHSWLHSRFTAPLGRVIG